jgi:FolB domain-containing protein
VRGRLYKIYIEDLKVQAIIGILDSERVKAQLVVINAQIEYDMSGNEFVNYADVVSMIEKMLVKNRYELLEVALDDIIDKVHKEFSQIKSIKLKINKPNILNNCNVGVELFRKI